MSTERYVDTERLLVVMVGPRHERVMRAATLTPLTMCSWPSMGISLPAMAGGKSERDSRIAVAFVGGAIIAVVRKGGR